MKGKCGGGHKDLGISLNFPSEKELLMYINKNYKACLECGKICKLSKMGFSGVDWKRGEIGRVCLDCMKFHV